MINGRIAQEKALCCHQLSRQNKQVPGLESAIGELANAKGDINTVGNNVLAQVTIRNAQSNIRVLFNEICKMVSEWAV